MSQHPSAAGGSPQPGYETWYEEPRETRLSVLAVLSLVLSLLCLTAPAGVILGVAALFLIGGSQGRVHGKGLAVSGVVIGLICSTCLTFALLSGLTGMRFMNSQAIGPAAKLMADIDAEDYAAARAALAGSAGPATTDEHFARFRAAYRAELGGVKKMPASLWEMIASYEQVGPAMQTFSRDFQTTGRGNNIIPLGADFDNGSAMVGVHINPQGGGPGGRIPLDNLLIITNKGTAIWLRDPWGGTGPAAPTNPADPDAPAPPENPPEAGSGGG